VQEIELRIWSRCRIQTRW